MNSELDAKLFTLYAEGWVVANTYDDALDAVFQVAANRGFSVVSLVKMTQHSSPTSTCYSYKVEVTNL